MRTLLRRFVSMTVGQRLFLGLLPSLLAVALALGLAYYGEYGRQAPTVIVTAAIVLAVASVVSTWVNTRYLTARISRLAGTMPRARAAVMMQQGRQADELDRIEEAVDRLGSALTAAEAERLQVAAAADARLREEATLLAAVVHDTMAQLDEVRLPLHILLETPFGDLNENQEELLATARDAANAMDDALRRLALMADADRGALTVQRELVQVNDVVRAVLPLARAAAERQGARMTSELEPGLPRLHIDRSRLAQVITLLAMEAALCANGERPLAISTARANGAVTVTVSPGGESILAERLMRAIGGRLVVAPESFIVELVERLVLLPESSSPIS